MKETLLDRLLWQPGVRGHAKNHVTGDSVITLSGGITEEEFNECQRNSNGGLGLLLEEQLRRLGYLKPDAHCKGFLVMDAALLAGQCISIRGMLIQEARNTAGEWEEWGGGVLTRGAAQRRLVMGLEVKVGIDN
ncbi:hypothetical protein Tco_0959170 [Tanacetum coccineum]